MVIDQLKALGMKVAHLEAQKQAAVEAEDYDTAKVLKGDVSAPAPRCLPPVPKYSPWQASARPRGDVCTPR